MPSDDELIIVRMGIEPELFKQHKTHLMRGWWKASDGRLYHQTITQLVLQMLEKKDSERVRKASYRYRMDAERRAPKAGAQSDLSHGTDVGQTWESGGIDDTRTITRTRTRTRTSSTGGEPPVTPSACGHSVDVEGGDAAQTRGNGSAGGQAVDAGTHVALDHEKPVMAGVDQPEWLPLSDWSDFVSMRKSMGKSVPFTIAAANGIVRELGKLRDQGQDPGDVLQQSVRSGWRSVFAVKGQVRPLAGRESRYAAAGRSLYGSGPAAGSGEVFDV